MVPQDVQARFEAMAEKNEASQKKQEEDVDSSLALLERLQQTHTTHTPHERWVAKPFGALQWLFLGV